MFLGIFAIGVLLVSVLLGIIFTPRIMRFFLVELGEAARANAQEKTQYSILDIYILIGQIAFYSLPAALLSKHIKQAPVELMIGSVAVISGYSFICWLQAVRLLSRARIKALWPRLVLLLMYPWMAFFALYYGINAISLALSLLFNPLTAIAAVGIFAVAALIFRAVARWLNGKREIPESPPQQVAPAQQPAPQLSNANGLRTFMAPDER